VGQTLAGYRLERLIGRGGMGEVYLAHDPRLDRPVALKLLSSELAEDEGFRKSLLRESRLAASLDHPNAVPIYEAGEEDGRLFVAMRYVAGTDLRALLRREGALDPARAVHLAGQVATALDAAHADGLVHRDVKPSNVLVDDLAGREHCYLADFGLTLRSSEGVLAEGSLMGTLDYIAPEQIRGDALDGAADQYALACLLYECLTGMAPFRRDSEVATLFAHLEEAPPLASDSHPGLPAELDAVLQRGMAKDPAERFPDCRGMLAAAEDALGVGRGMRRSHRIAVVAGVALAVTAAVAVALVASDPGKVAEDPPGSLVRLDPRSGKVEATHDLPASPSSVVVGGGVVWAGAYLDNVLWRLDPRTGALARVRSVGSPRDLAYRNDTVYVAADGPDRLEGNVVAYDADSGARLDGIELAVCSIVASAAEGVWATGCPNVERLGDDPRRLRVVQRRSLPFAEPLTSGTQRSCQCDMAAGGGSVWVLGDAADPRAWELDARSARVQRSIRFPFAIGRGIAAGPRAVWVAAPESDLVVRVDPGSGRITDRIRVGRGPASITRAGGRVFVSNWLDESVTVIDESSRRVERTVPVGGRPVELASDGRAVWTVVDG
jgi:YVTN family beta-propeller protein